MISIGRQRAGAQRQPAPHDSRHSWVCIALTAAPANLCAARLHQTVKLIDQAVPSPQPNRRPALRN